MPLQLRKGTEAERTTGIFIPAVGEPIYTVDTKQLFIGDGLTPGGVSVLNNTPLSEISDVLLNSENTASISEVSVASNVVTITTSSAHNFDAGDIVTVACDTNTQLNGSFTVALGALSNIFTYSLATPDLAAVQDTGTVTEVLTDGSVLTWSQSENAWVNLPPVTSVSALEDVSLTSLADGEILVYNDSTGFWENGPVATTIGSLTDVTIGTPAAGQVLVYDDTSSTWQNQTLSVSGLGSRVTSSATTSSIADGASSNIQITGFKSYMLMAIQVDAACWVTIYTSSAARTADASRPSYQDPLPGSGVVAEVIATAAGTQKITPSLLGFNDEATPTTDIYLKIENQSGASAAITVTLTLLQLEA